MKIVLEAIPVKTVVLFLLFITIFSGAKAQQQTVAEANYVHDRMYNLVVQSAAVNLPDSLTQKITWINRNNPYKQKTGFAQLSYLKVFYNTQLTSDDKRFFGNELLKNASDVFAPIHADVKKLLNSL
jgi:5'(3')-deoxyribonucleotidase